MGRTGNHRPLFAAWLIIVAMTLVPMAVHASETWIDDITALVNDHRELMRSEAREGAYNDYLGQLNIVRMAFASGNREATYVAMNRFMDMLERDPKGAGIPTWSAKSIFDFCGKVTPPEYHDAARHTELSKGGFDYWADNVYDPGAGG
ncbi:hypothetical protein [Candidatus Nitrospira bockiana]